MQINTTPGQMHPFLCMQCDDELVALHKPHLYCSIACEQEAELVRYVRRCKSDNRIEQEDIQLAVRLKMLHAIGLEKVVMLSGDNQRTASAIAKQAGIDEARGDLMPDQKVEHIRELVKTYQYVGMIGDGVNDAPALAVASVGIAMGAVGSDTAIETADMALMNDDLRKLADAIAVGRRTVRIIQFNVGFAIAVKAVFLILAFTGHSSLWMAILADTGATLLVIANALRLMRS